MKRAEAIAATVAFLALPAAATRETDASSSLQGLRNVVSLYDDRFALVEGRAVIVHVTAHATARISVTRPPEDQFEWIEAQGSSNVRAPALNVPARDDDLVSVTLVGLNPTWLFRTPSGGLYLFQFVFSNGRCRARTIERRDIVGMYGDAGTIVLVDAGLSTARIAS